MKPIRLLFAENVVSRGGSRLHQRVTFCVEVENLGFEKRVEVHWAGEDGSWRVIAANYTRSGGKREIWTAEAAFESCDSDGALPGHVEFALRYQVAGKEWWLKHGGHNYQIEADSGVLLGEGFAVVNIRPEPLLPPGPAAYPVTVAVREYFRPCSVELRWTTDQWRTAGSSSCQFSRHHWHKPHASGARNPNRYGIGIWTGQIPVERAARLEYAIACESSRGVFWDNNFGANYVARRNRLKVLTLNLHCYQEDNCDAKLWQIARAIDEHEVDIVCFQEVGEPWNGGKGDPPGNAARIIRNRLKQPYHLAEDWSHIGFGQYREGSAILSRYDLTLKDSRYVSASRDVYNIHARKIVMAQVNVPCFGAVNVYSTHLSWWSDGFQSQFESLRRWADENHTADVAATLLCGDFNAEPESEGYDIATQAGEYEDQYLKAQRKAAGARAQGDRRIDYIFLKKGCALEVAESRALFTPADYGPVSDHPAYYAEFELAG